MRTTPTFYCGCLLGPLLLFSFSFAQPSLPLNTAEQYLKCNATFITCGDVYTEIKFPFRTKDQQEYCGHPDYVLTCEDENKTLSMNISDKPYHLRRSIDYENQVLDLIDADLSAVTATNPCPEKITDSTILESTFVAYITNDTSLNLYLNCSFSTFPTPNKLFPIPCTSSPDFFGQSSFFTLAKVHIELPENEHCSSTLLVPVYDKFSLEDFISGGKTFSDVLKVGFGVTWTAGQSWCAECTSSGGICGYNVTNSSSPACFCPVGTRNVGTTCGHGTTRRTNKNKKLILLGVVSGVAVILALCCLYLYCCFRPKRQQHSSFTLYGFACRHNTSKDQTLETFLQKHGTLSVKRYSYSEVKKITKFFQHKLGQGGFGSVFKGTLPDGHAVAVKVLNNTDKDGDGEEFLNEVASIGRTSHVNIVCLVGFCFQGSKRALIYDFMPNGSLEKYIYVEDPKTILGWEKLFQIAVGIARGLEYLHRGCNTKIVHFDIKPHNILLDEDFCPKISDFGLAKFGTHKESILSLAGARGTIGYIAPEVFSRSFGIVSTKSDVYSYGMMILEMAGGRKNVKMTADRTSEIYFPHWIYEHLDEDEAMEHCGVTADTQDIAKKLVVVGLWCIQTRPESRPTMSKVVEMLEGSINDLELPPKPYLFSPRSPAICSSISMS